MNRDEREAVRARLAQLGVDGEWVAKYGSAFTSLLEMDQANLESIFFLTLGLGASCKSSLPPELVRELEEINERVCAAADAELKAEAEP